jgi:hypothetical protein
MIRKLGVLSATLAIVTLAAAAGTGQQPFDADANRAEALQYIQLNLSIQLTAEQEKIKEEALSAIPAPCCAEFSIATCCCPCNLAKTVWGLSKHLIVEKGYGAEHLRAAVVDYLQKINPDGFSGSSCFTGGCVKSFHHDGCGGMSDRQVL